MISEYFMRHVRLGTNPVFSRKTQDGTPESGRQTLELEASKCWASLLFLPLAVFVQNSGTHTIPKDSDWAVRDGVWHGYFHKLSCVSNLQPGLRSRFPYHLGNCQAHLFLWTFWLHLSIQHISIIPIPTLLNFDFPYNNSCLNIVPKLFTYLSREINHIWSIVQHVFGDYI